MAKCGQLWVTDCGGCLLSTRLFQIFHNKTVFNMVLLIVLALLAKGTNISLCLSVSPSLFWYQGLNLGALNC